MNGKREARVHALRVTYDAALTEATFMDSASGERRRFTLDSEPEAIAAWLGTIIGRPIALRCSDDGGFPDDESAPGPTIVSTSTLSTVASWFPGLGVDSVRRRLRANIEIDGVPPFWEDTLYGAADDTVVFRIGEVPFEGSNPCQRCVVPTRDPDSGEATPHFAKRVAELRAASLPVWAERSRFNHFYRLAVNTRSVAGQTGRSVHVGDVVRCTERLTPV